jgi:predicted small lipoprotein YifL
MRDTSTTVPRRSAILSAAILGLAMLALTGCGRKGDPELPAVAAEEEAQRKENAFPVPLPGESKPKAAAPKPKGHFLLDPLL